MTLVGISVRGSPVAGVMYQPFVEDGKSYWGIRGVGTHGLTPATREKKELILTVTSSRVTADTQRAVECIKPDRVVHAGGAGYKILLVMERKADVYVLPGRGTKKWDTCAPEAILRAAGGKLTDVDGSTFMNGERERRRTNFILPRPRIEDYQYSADVDHSNERGVIASLGIEHDNIINALAKR